MTVVIYEDNRNNINLYGCIYKYDRSAIKNLISFKYDNIAFNAV